MKKTLNATALDVVGRQSELIEFALTYKYDGLELDLDDLVSRAERTSLENATRFIKSANVNVSGYDSNIDLDADDISFSAMLTALPAKVETASSIGGNAITICLPYSTSRASGVEFLEVLKNRIEQIAGVLAEKDMKLVLRFMATVEGVDSSAQPCIRTTSDFVNLVKGIAATNVSALIEAWHWTVGGGNLDHLKEISADRIYGLRAANLPEGVSATEAKNGECMLPFETAVIDNVAILEYLKSVGFEGAVSIAGAPTTIDGSKRESIVHQASRAADRLISPETFVEEVPAAAESDSEDSEADTAEEITTA